MAERVYFKNLSALRFLAATAVIFHHVEQYKFWAGIPNVWGHTTVDALGSKAVSFFFVLSGFLITYLLMAERTKTGHISIKEFYVRRILRIWPVYYLVVFICLFVVPFIFDMSLLGIDLYDNKFWLKVTLFLLVLPNLVRLFAPSIAGANQLWTIGVEEQFYLVWPVFVRVFFRKLILFLILFVIAKFAVTAALDYSGGDEGGRLNMVFRFWTQLKIEQMGVGALGAWALFYQRKRLLTFIFHPLTMMLTVIMFGSLFLLPIHHWAVTYFEAFIFLSIIMNLSVNPRVRVSLEGTLMTTLGNISYGIYMYHTLCITACLYLLTSFDLNNTNLLLFNILLYTGSVTLTITVAYFSYEYFEKRFLRLKERFVIIKSGATTAEHEKEQIGVTQPRHQ